MFDPAPELLDGEDVVLHRLTVLFLVLLFQLRPQPGDHQISCNLRRSKAYLLLELGLTDHLAVTKLSNKVFCEMLTIVGEQVISLVGSDEMFPCSDYQY